MTDWAQALDLYEASLVHHQRLIDEDQVAQENPWPPPSLPAGPIPSEFEDRANELLERSHRIIDAMASKMANIPQRKPGRHHFHSTPDRPRWTATL